MSYQTSDHIHKLNHCCSWVPRSVLKKLINFRGFILIFVFTLLHIHTNAFAKAEEWVTLNDNGAWCWFQDERAIIHQGNLIVGSVANGPVGSLRRGDIDVVIYSLSTGSKNQVELHDRLQNDDHDVPALLALPDGKLLAVYSKHGNENKFYYTTTKSTKDFTSWSKSKKFVPSLTSGITYSNLHFLARENKGKGRIYNFYRGLDRLNKPSFCWSDDNAKSWKNGNIVINVPLKYKHRPYVKYASNGTDTIHLLYTNGHPRNYNNSIYHIYYKQGNLHNSNGKIICPLKEGLEDPSNGTRIFAGDSKNIAWTSDIHLDSEGRPHAVFSVRKNPSNIPKEETGNDIRYHYAKWNGQKWNENEIAYAGSSLYLQENDYTGNICLDPDDVNIIYISSNADPVTGSPLISNADGKRHYEIYKGETQDAGKSWKWIAITRDSDEDNLRPIVPKWNQSRTALLWYRGHYHTYVDYQTRVVLLLMNNNNCNID